jgi:chemotaxis protein methyltransferase CheR
MTTQATPRDETSFFRDARSFDVLRRSILPDLIARRSSARRLRIWSAGCSTGQEPYSLALILREHFPALAVWDVSILASDRLTERVDRVRRGRYTQAEVNRGLPASLLIKSFHRDGHDWTIDEPTRRPITPATIDLVGPWPSLAEFDLIALRNVLEQIEPEARREILARLARVIAPDGYLWLGSAETLNDLDHHFEPIEPGLGNFYRPRHR